MIMITTTTMPIVIVRLIACRRAVIFRDIILARDFLGSNKPFLGSYSDLFGNEHSKDILRASLISQSDFPKMAKAMGDWTMRIFAWFSGSSKVEFEISLVTPVYPIGSSGRLCRPNDRYGYYINSSNCLSALLRLHR